MKNRLLAVLLIVVNSALAAAAQAQDHDIVWVWNPQCSNPTYVALRVRFDGKSVYSASLPLCRWERRFEAGRAGFQFTPARPVVWSGYRENGGDGPKDKGDTTAAGVTLNIQFWQAGGESDAIMLGYSVAAGDVLHMNSLHILSPTARRASTMAPGLMLETWPDKRP